MRFLKMFEYPHWLIFFPLLLLVISVYTTCEYFITKNFERSRTQKQKFDGVYEISSRQIGKLVYFNGDSVILNSPKGRKEISRLILNPGTYLRDAFGTAFGYKKSFTDKQYDSFLKPGMLLK
nr:MAG: hypothetical protein [Porcellio scaber clopovirus]